MGRGELGEDGGSFSLSPLDRQAAFLAFFVLGYVRGGSEGVSNFS